MVDVPLGIGAYQRDFAGEPEVVLENRYFEKNPSNLIEKASLITRPGSNSLDQYIGGTIRGNYSKLGMFNGDLFTVSGHNLYRTNVTTEVETQITGTVAGDGFPYVTWMKGIGYEYLFISDGTSFQYFSEHATGTATLTGNVQEGMILDINGVYIGWSASVDHGSPAGTSSNPYWALLDSTGTTTAEQNSNSLANMVAALNFTGAGGLYSAAIPGPNAYVTATSTDTTIVLTAIDNTTAGNSITTSVFASGGGAIAFGGSHLTGGGGTQLNPVTGMGASEVAKACTSVSGYVLVSVGNSQKFYWLNPGEVIIDPLNFAEKESAPDNILDMLTIGDQALIMGNGSTENWYATGTFDAPLAPIEGRVYQRGVVEGTPVVCNDALVLVGNDGVVYLVGERFGAAAAQYGVHRVSTNGIEERIRVQLRIEQGLPP
jgi:hypothetical protein